MECSHHRWLTPDPSHLVSWVIFLIPSLLLKLGTVITNGIAIVDVFRLMGVEDYYCGYVGHLSEASRWLDTWAAVRRWYVKGLIHEWSFMSALASIWSKSWMIVDRDSCILHITCHYVILGRDLCNIH